MVGAGDHLAMDVTGGETEEKFQPEAIADSITDKKLEQKSVVTTTNEFGINKANAFNAYLKEYVGIRDTILDALIQSKKVWSKSVEGIGLEKIIGMALAANQQPQTNVNIGESMTKRLGGG